jgi:hypothetical protein
MIPERAQKACMPVWHLCALRNPRHSKRARSLAGQKTSHFFEFKRFRVLFFTNSRIFFKLYARFLSINDLFPAIILGLFKEKTGKIGDFNFFSTGNASKISMNSTASTLIKKPYEPC